MPLGKKADRERGAVRLYHGLLSFLVILPVFMVGFSWVRPELVRGGWGNATIDGFGIVVSGMLFLGGVAGLRLYVARCLRAERK